MAETKILVIYPRPLDVDAFEKVYVDEHVPLAMEKIKGVTKFAATKVVGTPDGSTPPSYDRTLPVQNAHTGISGSTQSFYPKPGGGAIWTEGHYQPAAQSATGAFPSTNVTGPKPH